MRKIIRLYVVVVIAISLGGAYAMASSKQKPKAVERANQHKNHKQHDHKDQKASLQKFKKGKLVLTVKGMVCAFCAQGIEKNFNQQEQVKSTKVNLDTMEVTIQLHPGKSLQEAKIKKIVTDAGFAYVGIKK